MLHQIQEIDTFILLWLNGLHNSQVDFLMYWATQRDTWIPLYALLIGWIVWEYKKKAPLMILSLILTIVAADQFTSSLLKPLVQRLRPCHVLYLQNKIHTITDCGGMYGFASSHAANSFGLAMTLWLMIGQKHPNIKWFFIWAALVSYSRVYAGVHYPLDIIAGASVGMICAWVCVKLKNAFLAFSLSVAKQDK
jgi:undecaprenyl-diphosphatase